MSDRAPSRADLLALLERTTDKDGWLDPLLADPDSETVIDAQADIFAAVGTASDYDTALGLISTAPGGLPGTSNITMSRAASGTAGTIPQGFRFIDTRGLACVASGDVQVTSGALQIVIPVQSLRQTELANTVDDPGFSIDPQSPIVLDSMASTVLIAPTGSPGIVSTTFTAVVKSDPISGAESDYLSLQGDERAQPRQPHEETEAYRARVRNIPDAVSPIAIADAVSGAASSAFLPQFDMAEPFEDGATPSLKAAHNLTSFGAVYCDDGYYGDGEVLDARSSRAYFRLEPTGPVNNPDGSGLYCDDGFCDDPVYGFADTGLNPQLLAALMSVWEEANKKRAGGVQFDVFVSEAKKLIGVGNSASGSLTGAWTLTPDAGKVWLFAEGFYGHDFALAPQPASGNVVGAFHRIKFIFSDSTQFILPDWSNIWDQHLTYDKLSALGFPWKPITSIQGYVESDGTHPMNLVGTVHVFEMAS